jgi:2-keto-3-deoxy-L-rhamnonate aldolase RhmA
MYENAYRARAERGEVQIGTWLTMIRTPAVLTLLRAAGLDFARIDMEHSPFSMETVAMLTDSVEGVREMIALGATIINYSSDAAVLRGGYAAMVAAVRSAR